MPPRGPYRRKSSLLVFGLVIGVLLFLTILIFEVAVLLQAIERVSW